MRIVYRRADVLNQIWESAEKIKKFYGADLDKVILVIILNGGLFYGSRLAKLLNIPDEKILYMEVGSYDGELQGQIRIIKDIPLEFTTGKKLLIVEDILDTRKTMKFILNDLNTNKNPESVHVTSLFDKTIKIEAGLEWIISEFGSLKITEDLWLGCCGMDFDFLEESRDFETLLAKEKSDDLKSPEKIKKEALNLIRGPNA